MKIMLSLLVLGQSLDALTFTLFYQIVPPGWQSAERNPLVVLMLATGGVALVSIVKVGLACWVAWRTSRSNKPLSELYLRIRSVVFPIAMASGFVGASFNSFAIWQVLHP